MSLLSAGALGVYRDLTARSQRVVVNGAVMRSGAVGSRRAGTATGLSRRASGRDRATVTPGAPALAAPADLASSGGTPGAGGGPTATPTTPAATGPAATSPAATGPVTTGPAVTTPMDDEADGGAVASFGQLLVAQIPSEALLAYTTLLALFTAAGDRYAAGRWALYVISLPACAAVVASAYFVKRGYVFADDDPAASSLQAVVRHLPWFPMAASVASMAVYGLTVPGCALQVSLSGPAFAISAGCLGVGGGLMMSLLAPWLGKGNAAEPRPAAA